MFRLHGKSDKTADVKFCDGCGVQGVTTGAQRSRHRMEDARTAGAPRGLTTR
jgi:hypothetical protein